MQAAATLQKTKSSVKKGKLKKTIKNILCRPDPIFWPIVPEVCENKIIMALNKYKINIPEFKKPHWNELKSIPKENRPKAPKLQKIDGLLFGVSECSNAIQKGKCSAVIIEAAVNPHAIVEHVLEACITGDVPVVCLNNLCNISAKYFAIRSSCIGIYNLPDLINQVADIAKETKYLQNVQKLQSKECDEKQDIEMTEAGVTENNTTVDSTPCLHLLRSDKCSRIFVPPTHQIPQITTDFIKISDKSVKTANTKPCMKMLLKRISNNPNRHAKKVRN